MATSPPLSSKSCVGIESIEAKTYLTFLQTVFVELHGTLSGLGLSSSLAIVWWKPFSLSSIHSFAAVSRSHDLP